MNLDSKIYVYAAWGGILLIGLATAGAVLQGDWISLSFLGGFLAVSVLFVAYERRLPALFDVLFVSSALVNAVGWAWDYYTTVWGYDELVHFYTTFSLTLSIGYLSFFAVRKHFRHHRAHFVLVISSFGISMGALWEIFEWIVLPKLTNPVEDLVMDSMGAILAGFVAAWALGAETAADLERSSAGPADEPAAG